MESLNSVHAVITLYGLGTSMHSDQFVVMLAVASGTALARGCVVKGRQFLVGFIMNIALGKDHHTINISYYNAS